MIDNRIAIIIVEDEPDTAEMFAEMMRLEGYNVLKSYGGEAAKELIEQCIPDLIILDIMMPDLSGLDVLRWMRGKEKLKNIATVVVSAKSRPMDIKAGLAAGATVYLTKPIAYQELRDAVTQALALSA